MMIHKPWGFAGGDANDMRDYADLLDKVESVLIPAYAEKTGKTTEEIAAMLDDETWMDGKESLAHGFADQVTTSLQAMACIQSKRIEDFEKMPNSIRNMITPPRNTTQREPQQPQPQVATTTIPAPASTSDEATIRAQVLAEQKNRVTAINDLFAMFGGKHHELQNKCIADPECTVAQAKDELLAALGKNATPSNKTTDAHIYAGNGNFVGDGVRQALMARAGFESLERDNVYNGMTLREYARMALTERGIGVSSYNPMQMVGMALTHSTSDFGNILLDVANKALLQGWEEAAETFEQWTKKGQLSDFKTAHRVGLGGFSSLRQVREGAEYKYVTTKDKGESIALATYGEIFSITRQAIINDDLNQLTDVPMKMGRAAIAYEAQWRRNDGNWVNVPRSSTTSFDVSGIYAGRYLVRVRAINASEISSGWGYSEEKTLTGKAGNPPKPVGFATTPINWGIRLNWGFPANTGDTLKTEVQYTANSDFSNPLLLSDVPYPSAEYTQLGLKAGQEFWYRAQLVDRTGNESGWTDWVRGESNANADDYLGDIADDFLTSADGDRLTGDIDTNLEAALQNALANHGTVEHQWAQYGEVRADILVVKTTIAQVDKAMAEMSTQVQAQIKDVTASLEDKLTATVDATSATAIHTLKVGVRINDIFYGAGMSIAVLAEAGKPVVTRVGFNANQFVLMSGSGDTQYSPFAVVDGQVFISDAFIQDGSITNAKIGNFIQSNNFVAGSAGWRIDKNGNAELHGKLYADSGQFAFNGTNNTVVINGNGLTVNLSGGGRVVVGRW